MEHVLRGLNWQTCLIYIDDIMIYSRNFDKHLHHLEDVFLDYGKLTLGLNHPNVSLHKIMSNTLGILFLEMTFTIVSAVTEFPVPKNTKGVCSFLGSANYYRRFRQGFSKLAAPLNQLLHKCVCLKWDESCQNTFDALKHALVTAPVLPFPDFSQPFDLYVDASLEGIGMTLGQTQKGHEVAIAYANRDNPCGS